MEEGYHAGGEETLGGDYCGLGRTSVVVVPRLGAPPTVALFLVIGDAPVTSTGGAASTSGGVVSVFHPASAGFR